MADFHSEQCRFSSFTSRCDFWNVCKSTYSQQKIQPEAQKKNIVQKTSMNRDVSVASVSLNPHKSWSQILIRRAHSPVILHVHFKQSDSTETFRILMWLISIMSYHNTKNINTSYPPIQNPNSRTHQHTFNHISGTDPWAAPVGSCVFYTAHIVHYMFYLIVLSFILLHTVRTHKVWWK